MRPSPMSWKLLMDYINYVYMVVARKWPYVIVSLLMIMTNAYIHMLLYNRIHTLYVSTNSYMYLLAIFIKKINIHIHMNICIYRHTCMYTRTHTCIHTYIHTYKHMGTYTRACIHTCIYNTFMYFYKSTGTYISKLI